MSLSELAERCEQAAGPDRELDEAIAAAVHLKQLTYSSPEWIKDPEFTTSLDGALTLVPEGCGLIYKRHGIKNVWRVQILSGGGETFVDGDAATPALALCAAALRARAKAPETGPLVAALRKVRSLIGVRKYASAMIHLDRALAKFGGESR